MRDLDNVFEALSRSTFRQKQKLNAKDQKYLNDRGLDTILDHAMKFILDRLAPESPKNDGEQTPMRGHPVFVAQHATATCCRSCLKRWHGIEKNKELTLEEQVYVISVIEKWLGQKIIVSQVSLLSI
jgi:hypothetical protein